MPVPNRPSQFHVRLRPLHGGAFTQWRISGSAPTATRPWRLARLMQELSLWSGWPVELALPAELETDDWFSLWLDMLADIPSDHRIVTDG
jgi:hypothetical protein